MSDREIMNAKHPPSAREILKKEYPTIYNGYQSIVDEQFELFARKHLDYGMHNVSAGTNLENSGPSGAINTFSTRLICISFF